MSSELICPSIDEFLRSDLVLDILEDLIGSDIALYLSKLRPKCAGDGQPIPWHQDYACWEHEKNRSLMINGQFAIGPATKENGCIQFVSGFATTNVEANPFGPVSLGTIKNGTMPCPLIWILGM